MRGVEIKKAKIVHEDDRRRLLELFNGEITAKSVKIIEVKNGDMILGNHYHTYNEGMYLMKGKAHYHMKNMLTGESMEVELEAGDFLFKTGHIAHAGIFSEDSIIIDFAEQPWLSEDFNHIREKLV